MIKLSTDKAKLLEEELGKIEAEADIDVIKNAKDVLNKVFGEEYNQIAKLSAEEIFSILEEIGYNSYDINNMSTDEFTRRIKRTIEDYPFKILIHVPETEITNKNKNSLILKDIYVRISMTKKGTLRGGISGVRATLQEDQFLARYSHSHLPTFEPSRIMFQNFCTGEGEINQVISLLRTKFTEPNFMLFCLHLKNFLAWESIEGNPYMFLENVKINKAGGVRCNSSNAAMSKLVFEKILPILKKKIFLNLLKIDINDKRILVEKTDGFELFLGEVIKSFTEVYTGMHSTFFLCTKSTAGQYYAFQPTATNGTIRHQTASILKFKEREIFFKVEKNIENETEKEQTTRIYAIPDFTNHVCKFLSEKFTEIAFDLGGIEVKSASVSLAEAAKPDPIPM